MSNRRGDFSNNVGLFVMGLVSTEFPRIIGKRYIITGPDPAKSGLYRGQGTSDTKSMETEKKAFKMI